MLPAALFAVAVAACASGDDPSDEAVPTPQPHTARRAARASRASPDQFAFVLTPELIALTAKPRAEWDFVLADARFRVEYDEQHIPGAINARADIAATALAERHVAPTRRVIFYCNGPTCTKSKKAAGIARKAGYTNLAIYDEGLPAWMTAAQPVEGTPLPKFDAAGLTPAALRDVLASDPGVFVVDVRPASEFAAFHVASAHNLPLDEVEQRKAELPTTGMIVIVEHAGHQRAIAGRLFHSLGLPTIRTLEGGTLAWQQANLPLAKAVPGETRP